jgi:hypothetical protein
MDYNSKLLSESMLKNSQIPKFNRLYVRINSFGELINDIHLQNILLIAINNPNTTFTLFTKRVDLVKKLPSKPKNMIFIYSNPILNSGFEKIPKGFDKIFTVFDKQTVKERKIKINCMKNCMSCLKCYTRNDINQIRELIK